MARNRIGIWLIGAKGGVATTAITGLLALRKGLIGDAGLITTTSRFAGLELAGWDDFVVGGHDIREGRLHLEAMRMHSESRAIDPTLFEKLRGDFDEIEKNLRPGTILNVGPTISKFAAEDLQKVRETPQDVIDRVQNDLREFIEANKLAHVIVVNVSSTEPPVDAALPERWRDLAKLIDEPAKCPLPASSLYAIAALDLGLLVHQLHAVAGSPRRGDRRAGRRARRAAHGLRRQDRRDAAQERAGADVRQAKPGGDELGRAQHLRQHGRQGARRSGEQEEQGHEQGPAAGADSGLSARKRWSRSSTSRAWATGRPPGTTCISRVSWARR